MTFVVTDGQLAALDRMPTRIPAASVRINDRLSLSYPDIWRTQPQVRTVVSFLARNIAQIGLHVYERVSDTDRKRLTDHPLAVLLGRPNPRTTPYRFKEALVSDMGIHDNAIILKAALSGGQPLGLLRLDPSKVSPVGDNPLWPDAYRLRGARGYRDLAPDQVIHFRGFNPADGRWGVSPLETLRRILTEEYEAGNWREQLWRNGARFSGVISRPKEAGNWSDSAAERFRANWRGLYTGDGPGAGGTPVLEDGMTFTAAGVTPEQAQYLEARKLTREEVAAAFHIPLPMVGILDHATFSNIEEQHRNLYQDTLGPWLQMISEEIALQLLPDLDTSSKVYVEFNLADKMAGSFEQQSQSFQTAVGGPIMTPNEARARVNLPAIEGGDELIRPLNVTTGAQASPTDSAPPKARGADVKARASDDQQAAAVETLRKFFRRQRRGVMGALGSKAGPDWWDADKWNAELAADLYALAVSVSTVIGREVSKSLGFDPGSYDVARTQAFLAAVSESRAKMINQATLDAITEALASADESLTAAKVFDDAEGYRAERWGKSLSTTISAFASTEAAKQQAPDDATPTKTWRVNSRNPRPAHARMAGQTVPVGSKFSNGAEWPGDPVLGVDGVAGCTCSVDVSV